MDHHWPWGGARFRSISTCQSTDWHVLLLSIFTYRQRIRPSGGRSSSATNAATPVGSNGRKQRSRCAIYTTTPMGRNAEQPQQHILD
ncbi:hypothetical protein P8452_06828 [Trifolium repens]|nr:hypothetical protein P8452_06828 [Trifolium repens]